VNTATEATVLPLCSLRFESADLRSPNRSLRSQRVTRTHDIFIAGNRIQFSRTEGKDFPSERVAVFSLSGLCCQRLFETFFSPFCFGLFFPLHFCGASRVRSGSRYLVSVVFAVKDFRNFLFTAFASSSFSPAFLRGSEGPKRVAVSSLCRLCCQRLCETFFSRPRFKLFLCRAASCEALGVGGVRSGRRCMLPVGVSRQVLLSLSVVFQKTPQFQGFPIEKDSTFVQ
jgi:hypothetical protein